MAPVLVDLTEDVEKEGVHIVVQRFVVQEQLREEAQVLRWQRDTTCMSIALPHWEEAPLSSSSLHTLCSSKQPQGVHHVLTWQ